MGDLGFEILDMIDEQNKQSTQTNLGHDTPQQIMEHFDDPDEFRNKCRELANLISHAKYVVVYTGAGISTSARIPDYRGPKGLWTLKDKGLRINRDEYVEIEHAIPTLSHMAIAELERRGSVKHVISTNIDGLHLRSGLPIERLSELHGNTYLEVCQKCKESYLRPYDCMKFQDNETRKVNVHFNGKYCEREGCGGQLFDSIIHFGENLPQKELTEAEIQSNRGDLAIVLGTSMKVPPSCYLPRSIYDKEGGKMVICNLQKTQFDDFSVFNIRGHIDDIFHIVMEELGIEIPMVTPEGYEVTPYEDKINEKHQRRD